MTLRFEKPTLVRIQGGYLVRFVPIRDSAARRLARRIRTRVFRPRPAAVRSAH